MSDNIQIGKLVAGLGMDTSGFTKGIESAAGSLDSFKATIGRVQAALTTMLTNPVVLGAAAIAALVALGKAAYDAYVEIDKAYDALAVGTGAVGENLEELKQSFDDVFANATYVSGAEELAAVIADLNTYLGVTGDELEELATQFSNLEGLGAAASVDTFSQALNKWGVSAEDASGYLDYFFWISQNTGISIDALASSLESSKSVLDVFGFSLQESAQLIGTMNKAGYDTSTIQTALRQLAAAGVTTRKQFEGVITSIKNATDSTTAMKTAVQMFGARAGAEMVALIQGGLLDELGGGFEDAAGAINDTAASTADLEDRFDQMGRRMQVGLSAAGEVIAGIFNKLFDVFEWAGSVSGKLLAPIQKLFARIGESFSKFWNDGEDNTGSAIDTITGFIEGLVDTASKGLDWFLEFVYPAIEGVIQDIVSVVKIFTALISGDWESMFKNLNDLTVRGMSLLYTVLEFVVDHIAEMIETAIQAVVSWVYEKVNDMLKFFSDAANGWIGMINGIISGLNMIPGIDIEALGTVDWQVETPQIELGRFADTGLGQNMRQFIDAGGFDYQLAAELFAESPIAVTVQGISDAYEVTTKQRDTATAAVYNPTRV